jgi:hypothetical protein
LRSQPGALGSRLTATGRAGEPVMCGPRTGGLAGRSVGVGDGDSVPLGRAPGVPFAPGVVDALGPGVPLAPGVPCAAGLADGGVPRPAVPGVAVRCPAEPAGGVATSAR